MEQTIKDLVTAIIANAELDITLGDVKEGKGTKSNLVSALKECGYTKEEIVELFN